MVRFYTRTMRLLTSAHPIWRTLSRSPREGKRVALFSVTDEQSRHGKTHTCRRVMQITERTMTPQGQLLLMPDIEIEGWWTSLPAVDYDDAMIIVLYRDHATAEQFHSEFKTDLDIERLPSGKFATNDLIMSLSAYSYYTLQGTTSCAGSASSACWVNKAPSDILPNGGASKP